MSWVAGYSRHSPPVGTEEFPDRCLSARARSGKRSRTGTQKYLDGGTYKGGWLNDMRHGEGQWVQANGTVRIGNFAYDQPDGEVRQRRDGQEAVLLYMEGKVVSTIGASA